MNAIWGHVSGVVTVVLMLTFVGIWAWPSEDRDREQRT
jgi:cytochrome c oxidase cbb3-type subunit 4